MPPLLGKVSWDFSDNYVTANPTQKGKEVYRVTSRTEPPKTTAPGEPLSLKDPVDEKKPVENLPVSLPEVKVNLEANESPSVQAKSNTGSGFSFVSKQTLKSLKKPSPAVNVSANKLPEVTETKMEVANTPVKKRHVSYVQASAPKPYYNAVNLSDSDLLPSLEEEYPGARRDLQHVKNNNERGREWAGGITLEEDEQLASAKDSLRRHR